MAVLERDTLIKAGPKDRLLGPSSPNDSLTAAPDDDITPLAMADVVAVDKEPTCVQPYH